MYKSVSMIWSMMEVLFMRGRQFCETKKKSIRDFESEKSMLDIVCVYSCISGFKSRQMSKSGIWEYGLVSCLSKWLSGFVEV